MGGDPSAKEGELRVEQIFPIVFLFISVVNQHIQNNLHGVLQAIKVYII